MRFPMDTYRGEETSQGEYFQLNVITSLIWDFFFKWRFPFWHIQRFFRVNFGEVHTSLTTSTQRLLFRSIYFFRAAAFYKELRFRSSHFLAAVIFFSEYLIFKDETSTEQPLCENRKFFKAVTSRNSYFFGGVIAQNKDNYRRAPLIEAGTSAQHQLLQKSYIFEKPAFPGEISFWSGHFFKRCYLLQQQPFQKCQGRGRYFLTTYFFRRVAISQLRFLSKATRTVYQLVIK